MKILNILTKSRRRLLVIASLACLLPVFSVSAAYAASATTPGSNTAAAKSLLNTIITKGNNEIDRRLTTLNSLNSKISSSTKIAASDKTALTTEVNNEISGLAALKATLDACTTLSCAKTSAQSIFTEYRVYALVVPQVAMIKTADDQQLTETKLSTIAAQLTTRLSSSSANSSALESDLTTMKSDISAAQSLSANVETTVEALTPANYDNNHSLLVQYYNSLKTAQSDNQSAYSLAKTIYQALTASKTN